MISFKTKYDAIVVGAGPAGSTTAALLAEKGRDVLVLEKEKFRYHVGESLMPFCYFPRTTGVGGSIDGVRKPKKVLRSICESAEDGFLFPALLFFPTL